jgi:hypothetical protein
MMSSEGESLGGLRGAMAEALAADVARGGMGKEDADAILGRPEEWDGVEGAAERLGEWVSREVVLRGNPEAPLPRGLMRARKR